jgi:hypothetical protein
VQSVRYVLLKKRVKQIYCQKDGDGFGSDPEAVEWFIS